MRIHPNDEPQTFRLTIVLMCLLSLLGAVAGCTDAPAMAERDTTIPTTNRSN